MTETITYGKDGKVTSRTRFQATLDRRGNWIKRRETPLDANGKASGAQFTSVRTITYY